ncbi:hypothetical protein B0H19DRAFT_1069334 [Mycena capillaripes]|nr:hypothetical protein B0H19DRAFT_1069334 [Mycena capillaripes]
MVCLFYTTSTSGIHACRRRPPCDLFLATSSFRWVNKVLLASTKNPDDDTDSTRSLSPPSRASHRAYLANLCARPNTASVLAMTRRPPVTGDSHWSVRPRVWCSAVMHASLRRGCAREVYTDTVIHDAALHRMGARCWRACGVQGGLLWRCVGVFGCEMMLGAGTRASVPAVYGRLMRALCVWSWTRRAVSVRTRSECINAGNGAQAQMARDGGALRTNTGSSGQVWEMQTAGTGAGSVEEHQYAVLSSALIQREARVGVRALLHMTSR